MYTKVRWYDHSQAEGMLVTETNVYIFTSKSETFVKSKTKDVKTNVLSKAFFSTNTKLCPRILKLTLASLWSRRNYLYKNLEHNSISSDKQSFFNYSSKNHNISTYPFLFIIRRFECYYTHCQETALN